MTDPLSRLRAMSNPGWKSPLEELRSLSLIGAWEPTESPNVQKRRRPDGSYEFRPNPAGFEGAPGVEHKSEPDREALMMEAIHRERKLPESGSRFVVDQLAPRVAANIASLPEAPSMAAGLLDRGMGRDNSAIPAGRGAGMAAKMTGTQDPGSLDLSAATMLNPRRLYSDSANAAVDKIHEKRGAAQDQLIGAATEAGLSPEAAALADTGFEVAAMQLDPTNALLEIGGLHGAGRARAAKALAEMPDAVLRPEIPLAEQLPEDAIRSGGSLDALAEQYVSRRTAPVIEPRLEARVPRWASSIEEGVQRFQDFADANRGKAVSAADLPFELKDLPLSRFDQGGRDVARGGRFYTLGDSNAYFNRWRDPSELGSNSTGGPVGRAETFTPENPLVYVREKGPRGADEFDMDASLIRSATAAGHDAIVLVSGDANRIEVIKTPLAKEGAPRRSAHLERALEHGYEGGARMRWAQSATWDEMFPGEPRPAPESLAAWREGERLREWPNLLGAGRTRGEATMARPLVEPAAEFTGPGRGFEGMPGDDVYVPARPEATGAEIARAIREAQQRGFRQVRTESPPEARFSAYVREQGFDPYDLSSTQEDILRKEWHAIETSRPIDLRPDALYDPKAKMVRVGDAEFDQIWKAESYRDSLDPATGQPPPTLTRERWEQLRAGQSDQTAGRLKAAREGLDRPVAPQESQAQSGVGVQAAETYGGQRAAVEDQIKSGVDQGLIQPGQVADLRAQNLRALDADWHQKLTHAASQSDDPTLAMLADETEAATVQPLEAPPLRPYSPPKLRPVGDFREVTQATPPHYQPATPHPSDSVIRYGPDPKLPVAQRLRKMSDEFIDKYSNKEEGPVRLLRRAGLKDEARELEMYIGKKRGAARIAANVTKKGVVIWDPVTQGSRRIYDSFESIVGGLDGQAYRDLNDFMAAQHHMELVVRQERAALEFDMARARRLEEMRQARQADKASLRSMSGDIRDTRAAELSAVRKAAREGGAARARLAGERALTREADSVHARADKLREEALVAAERSRETGFDQARAEYAVASQYARKLLREELRNAVSKPRAGSVDGLTKGVAARSPGAVSDIDRAALALSRVASDMGIEEGRLRAMLSSSRSMEYAGRSLQRAAAEQAEAATGALVREARVDLLGAGRDARSAISSAQRVAMGIRDEATNFRKRFPPVNAHPDAYLNIHPEGTRIAQGILDDIHQRYGIDPVSGEVNQLGDRANRIREWSNAAIIEQLDSVGFFSPNRKAAVLAKNKEYAPFLRLLDEVADDPAILAGGSTSNPIKKISGGLSPDAPIAPPLESFVAQAQRIALWVEKQRVKNLLGDFAETHPAEVGKEIKRVNAAQSTDAFQVFRDGERHLYSAPADVLKAVDNLTPTQTNIFMQAGVMAARMLRAGATLTLDFALRNFLRDQATAGVYGAEFHYRPIFDFLTGLRAQTVFGKQLRQFVEQWESAGGALSDYINLERPQVQLKAHAAAGLVRLPGGRLVRAPKIAHLIADWSAEKNVFAKVMYPVLKPLESMGGAVEQATRIGAFRRAKLGGATDLAAANFSRNITLDFGRVGSAVQRWNSVEAFANANLQDVARFSRAMRERPIATTLSAGAFVTIPSLAVYWAHKDDPAYRNLPEYEKANFLHVEKIDKAGRWLRLPRPQGLMNLLFGYGITKALDAANDKLGPHPVNELLSTIFNETPLRYSPVQPDPQGGVQGSLEFLPTAMQPIAEVAAGDSGWSSYRQGPIVPQGLEEGAVPEERYLDSTSATARWLGQKTGAAPLKIDYLIRGYGAGLTTTIMRAIENATGAGNEQLPELPKSAKDIPALGGLVSASPYGFASQPVQDLYALEKQAAAAKANLKAAAEQGRIADYQRILREHPEARFADELAAAKSDLGDLRKERREIRVAPGMEMEKRADMLLQRDQAATQIAAGTMHWVTDMLRGIDRKQSQPAKPQDPLDRLRAMPRERRNFRHVGGAHDGPYPRTSDEVDASGTPPLRRRTLADIARAGARREPYPPSLVPGGTETELQKKNRREIGETAKVWQRTLKNRGIEQPNGELFGLGEYFLGKEVARQGLNQNPDTAMEKLGVAGRRAIKEKGPELGRQLSWWNIQRSLLDGVTTESTEQITEILKTARELHDKGVRGTDFWRRIGTMFDDKKAFVE